MESLYGLTYEVLDLKKLDIALRFHPESLYKIDDR